MTGPSDMAVVVCYFNHHDFDTPIRNLRRFCRFMKQVGANLYGMEMLSPNGKSETAGLYGEWTTVAGNNKTYLWQKEAMWNRVAATLPSRFTKVFCCDTDIWFENLEFLNLTSIALDTSKVVMPFTKAIWTDHRGKEYRERDDALTAYKRTGKYNEEGHQGFATAFNRDLWNKKINIFSYTITGAGDSAMWCALTNDENQRKYVIRYGVGGDAMLPNFDRWAAQLREWCGDAIGNVPGTIYHEHHGNRDNRNYMKRHDAIQGMLPQHLAVRVDGLIQWTDTAPMDMMYGVYKYFFDRKEDAL